MLTMMMAGVEGDDDSSVGNDDYGVDDNDEDDDYGVDDNDVDYCCR